MQLGQYPVKPMEGLIRLPKDLHKDSDGVWRDALSKLVEPPGVNFAGSITLQGILAERGAATIH